VLTKKLHSEETNFKNIREDYESLNKKFYGMKKQNENVLNNYEDIKEEVFLIKQENENLKKKISNNIAVQEHYRELSKERDLKVLFDILYF